MRRLILAATALLLAALPALAETDVFQVPACKYCGMDRQKWAHSRALIEYEDGSSTGTCSLHCAAVDLAVNIDKAPKTIWVADMESKKLIDAEKAFWVVVRDKPGVMTGQAKWAFETAEAANKYIKENGGAAATFDEAIRAAYEDMDKDTKAIRERRASRRKAAGAPAPTDMK